MITLVSAVAFVLVASAACSKKSPEAAAEKHDPVRTAEIKCKLSDLKGVSAYMDESIGLMTITAGQFGSLRCAIPPSDDYKEVGLALSEMREKLLTTERFGNIMIFLDTSTNPGSLMLGLTKKQKDELLAYLGRHP